MMVGIGEEVVLYVMTVSSGLIVKRYRPKGNLRIVGLWKRFIVKKLQIENILLVETMKLIWILMDHKEAETKMSLLKSQTNANQQTKEEA